jgi:hypothetical protein
VTELTSRIGKTVMGSNSNADELTKKTRTSPADVIMWSGCKDSQTVSLLPFERRELLYLRHRIFRVDANMHAECRHL